MDRSQKEKNIEIVKEVLRQYLQKKQYRSTPERFAIIEEIYNLDQHFNVDDLYLIMIQKKYQVSKATIYNSVEIFLDAGLIRKHQFEDRSSSSTYEKSYFNKQHDHLIVYKHDGSEREIDEIIEFCDPRIQGIKESIEDAFGVNIDSHSLYFYGYKREE